jgi:hypothetical protein
VTFRQCVHPDAEAEFLDAVRHYHATQAGLGEEFDIEVAKAVDDIQWNPEAWPKFPGWNRPTTTAPEWLIGTALLAYPIAPASAQQVWTALGLPGEPSASIVSTGAEVGRQSFPAADDHPLGADALRPFMHQGVSA